MHAMMRARRFMPSRFPQWEKLRAALLALVAAIDAERFELPAFYAALRSARGLLDDTGLRGEFDGPGALAGEDAGAYQTAPQGDPISGLARYLVGGRDLTEKEVEAELGRWPKPQEARHRMTCYLRDAFNDLFADTKPARPPDECPVTVSREEAAVLKVMLAHHPVRVTVERLASRLRLDEKSIRTYLASLQERGLVTEPVGKTGRSLTAAGLELVRALPAGVEGNLIRKHG
jgi:hypothetical protein